MKLPTAKVRRPPVWILHHKRNILTALCPLHCNPPTPLLPRVQTGTSGANSTCKIRRRSELDKGKSKGSCNLASCARLCFSSPLSRELCLYHYRIFEASSSTDTTNTSRSCHTFKTHQRPKKRRDIHNKSGIKKPVHECSPQVSERKHLTKHWMILRAYTLGT